MGRFLGLAKIVSVCTLIVSLTACGHAPSTPSATDVTSATDSVSDAVFGDVFLKSNLKIQSTISDNSTDPKREAMVELYVDENGNGSGLFGFGDYVLDVIVVQDNLYVVVDTNVVVGLSDISGRLVFSDTQFTGQADLRTLGFKVDNHGVPVEYSARKGSIVIDSKYAQSVNTFEAQSVLATSTMTFADLLTYIMDYNAQIEAPVETEPQEDIVEDFYINSKYGVTIDNKVFSVGDTCNPNTYFNNATPEGILETHEYKEDTRVDFQHVSYLSNTGRTVFVLTNNYVQAIQTDADFNFLGIHNGLTDKELKAILGVNLSSKEQAVFKPVDENLVFVDNKNSTYYCAVGNLSVEFRMDKSILTELYIEQVLDFKE